MSMLFIGNHHVMNLHQNRLNLTDESESETDYDEYAEAYDHRHHHHPTVKRSCMSRPRSHIASRPIRPEDDDVSAQERGSKSSSRHSKAESSRMSKNLEYNEARPRYMKNGNKAVTRRFSKKEEDYNEEDETVSVRSYSDAKNESFGEYVEYNRHSKSESNRNLDRRPEVRDSKESVVIHYAPKQGEKAKVDATYEVNDFQVKRNIPHEDIQSVNRMGPTRSELSQYNHAIDNYVQSTAKMIKKDSNLPKIKQHETFVAISAEKFFPNKSSFYSENQHVTSKKGSADDVASQIIRDLKNINIGDSDVKYY